MICVNLLVIPGIWNNKGKTYYEIILTHPYILLREIIVERFINNSIYMLLIEFWDV